MILTAFSAHAAEAQAQAEPKIRPCVTEDVVGTWSLLSIRQTPPGSTQEFYRLNPYEILRFEGNGDFSYVASPKRPAKEDYAKNLDAAKALAPNMRFEIQQGRLLVTSDGRPFNLFACGIALESFGQISPGNMLWFTPDGDNGSKVARLHERVE